MRFGDRYARLDVSEEDVQRERARAPRSRQLCPASMRQLMEDAGKKVRCPECGRSFDVFDVQQNRAQRCPIVPSHLPDFEGRAQIEFEKARRQSAGLPRPY